MRSDAGERASGRPKCRGEKSARRADKKGAGRQRRTRGETYDGRLSDGYPIGQDLLEVDALLAGSVGEPAGRARRRFLAGVLHRASANGHTKNTHTRVKSVLLFMGAVGRLFHGRSIMRRSRNGRTPESISVGGAVVGGRTTGRERETGQKSSLRFVTPDKKAGNATTDIQSRCSRRH